MKNNFAFIQLSDVISGVVLLPREAKEKKNPFIIINTDNDRGLYVQKLEQEIAKYKGLKSADGESKFYDIETSNMIVFGNNPNFDYKIDMNYITLNSLLGRNVKVYDIVDDYPNIVRRLATYCKNNGNKRKYVYRDEDVNIRFNVRIADEPKRSCPVTCPLLERRYAAPVVKRTLVNVCPCPDTTVEKITVHANWVKIGYHQYDILVDLCGNESIFLEDGTQLSVNEDRFGRRYLAV